MSQHFFFFFFFFIPLFSFFLKSNAQESNSPPYSCPEHVCNGVRVHYPFWRLDNTTLGQYCGYPGFGIDCSTSAGHPIINISNQSYIVRDISYADHTLTLNDIAVSVNRTCPRPLHNLTLGTSSLWSYSELDSDLTFYFNCSSPIRHGVPIVCLRSGDNESYFEIGIKEPENSNWLDICEEKVKARVSYDQAPGSGVVMTEGFVLGWRAGKECSECEESHGNCSYYSNTTMACFCNDGSIHKDNCRNKGENKRDVKLKIGIGIGAAAFGAIGMSVIFFLFHRRFKKRYSISSIASRDTSSYPNSASELEKASNYYGAHVFHYDELEEATNNFDSTKELGDGGFGIVYKGKLRDGRVVAIKRLYDNNYKRVEQFMNEVELLTRLHHQNLVSLYGCTSYRGRELLLVYEYISNGTLADNLHGPHARPGLLSWTTRLSISIETASALAYLHASEVIHRDVKSNNILLDKNFSVKVADFGLSRLLPNNVTHVSTAPQGTPGYVDPEYHQFYHLTDKSDVYSFGVVLIELISSKPAVDITRHRHEINLSNMAVTKIQNNELHELVDPHLGFELDPKVKTMITVVAELAFRCLQLSREMRPTMKEVLEVLQGIQSDNYRVMKAEEMDIPSDDVLLLKNDVLACSSDSETARSAKDNVSG